jgi:hypothetical protein
VTSVAGEMAKAGMSARAGEASLLATPDFHHEMQATSAFGSANVRGMNNVRLLASDVAIRAYFFLIASPMSSMASPTLRLARPMVS